jgi:hypothetical protein
MEELSQVNEVNENILVNNEYLIRFEYSLTSDEETLTLYFRDNSYGRVRRVNNEFNSEFFSPKKRKSKKPKVLESKLRKLGDEILNFLCDVPVSEQGTDFILGYVRSFSRER